MKLKYEQLEGLHGAVLWCRKDIRMYSYRKNALPLTASIQNVVQLRGQKESFGKHF